MAYSRKQWEIDITHLNADNFNNMEDGIQESLRRVQTTEDEIDCSITIIKHWR